jgi:hypothetical protein
MVGPAVAAVAWSIDGTTFSYRSPVGGGVQLGAYVMIETPQGALLGQVLSQRDLEEAGHRLVTGTGRLLETPPGQLAFDEVAISRHQRGRSREQLGRRGATLELGTLRDAPGSRLGWSRRASTGTRSCAGSRDRGRPTASGDSSRSSCCAHPAATAGARPERRPRPPRADPARRRPSSRRGLHRGRTRRPGPGRGATGRGGAAAYPDAGARGCGVAALMQLDPIADREEYNALLHACCATRPTRASGPSRTRPRRSAPAATRCSS